MDAIRQAVDGVRARVPEQRARAQDQADARSVTVPLDKLIAACGAYNADVPPEEAARSLQALAKQCHDAQQSVHGTHKQLYNALQKLGRAVDRKFATPIDDAIDPSLFESTACREALNRVIMEHLMRTGREEVADQFAGEVGETLAHARAASLHTLNQIVEQLEAGNLQPAMDWAMTHQAALHERHSPLLFLLYRNVFLRMAMSETHAAPPTEGQTNVEAAFAYGRRHFVPFLGTHAAEIQRLLALLLYLPRFPLDAKTAAPAREILLRTVPAMYRGMLSTLFDDTTPLAARFLTEYCAVAQIPRISPLRASVDVGANTALSRILKVRSVMKQSGNEWSQADELPIEIPLPPELELHSTFLCPVSKEPGTEENPPMMLPCGHVLCLYSLTRLARGGTRVKCTYCPAEADLAQTMRVYF